MLTRKDVYSRFVRVYRCGDFQHFERFFSKIGYNAGSLGHNFDCFAIGVNAVCAGYRPIGEKLPDECRKIIEEVTAAYHDYMTGKIGRDDFDQFSENAAKRFYNALNNPER